MTKQNKASQDKEFLTLGQVEECKLLLNAGISRIIRGMNALYLVKDMYGLTNEGLVKLINQAYDEEYNLPDDPKADVFLFPTIVNALERMFP